ncbi:MAG: VWA domain-containing protein [Lachnospiraceae bacterium]|nr:VWA domain-containing protein [Lachnospiraceae bacterium]
MNAFLQVGLGLIPGAVVMILLLIKRRAFHFRGIFMTLLLTAACVAAIVYGAKDAVRTAQHKSVQMTQEKMISFANALGQGGAYDAAQEVLDQYGEGYGYDDECRLLSARLAFWREEFDKASALYDYLASRTELISAKAAEVLFAKEHADNKDADLAMIAYLRQIGENPEDYGYVDEQEEQDQSEEKALSMEDVCKRIKTSIEDAYPMDDDISSCVKAVREISKTYGDDSAATNVKKSGSGEGGDAEDPSTVYRRYKHVFEDLEETAPEYLQIKCVNKAWIKATVLDGSFSSLTERLTADSSYHELMIASELYMSKLVKKTNFSEDFQTVDKELAREVKERMKEILDKQSDNMNAAQRKALKERIDAYQNQLKEPVLGKIKILLIQALEEEVGPDETKIYLELAKIENYFGDEATTDAYFSKAIYSSQESEDDSYVEGMTQIITVINGDNEGDGEKIKNVSEYVNTVLDHSLTVNVEKIVSPQYQPENPNQNNNNNANRSTDDDDNDDENDDENASLGSTDFTQTAVDFVSRTKSAVTIGRIDASQFEEITARVQIDSKFGATAEELKPLLEIYDCGAQITDFTIEKVEYTQSKILLLCDVSGSMSSAMGDLRNAVITFAQDKDEKEDISVVTFSSGIGSSAPFGTSKEDLITFAEGMRSNGGTEMFNSAVICLDQFSATPGVNNVLIVMTDGQDNSRQSYDNIKTKLGIPAQDRNLLIYTMGLGGNVDTGYLTSIAEIGNGSFIYVSDSTSLTGFYDMLHSQLSSQYEIKYRAKDTMTAKGRTLEVMLPDENVRDMKTYSLPGTEESGSEENLKIEQELRIAGLAPRRIYKGLKDVTVKLRGSGFDPDKQITVTLNGVIDYKLEAKYVDDTTYELTVPYSVAVGTYNVEISLDGKKTVLTNGFTVVEQGDMKKTIFGPYVFTSTEKIEVSNNKLCLRGDVTLNGWLHFKQDVILYGDLENSSAIKVTDNGGSYVEYYKGTAEGIGKFLADKGIAMDVPKLNTFSIYNDIATSNDYENYQVDDIVTAPLAVYQVLRLDAPTLQLRPNSIGIYYKTGTTLLPFQDTIMDAPGVDANLFKFNFDGSARLTSKNVGIVFETEFGTPKSSEKNICFFKLPVQLDGGLKAKVDTLKNEYTLGLNIGFDFVGGDEAGFEAEANWKGSLIPDSGKIVIKIPGGVKLPTAVPIVLNDFGFEVSDINTAIADHDWTKLTFGGSMELSCLDLGSYAPALVDYIGDISLLKMPDTKASIRINPFRIEAEAQLKFLEEITLAKAKAQLGCFEYTNDLLGLDGVDVKGLNSELTIGIMWEGMDKRMTLDFSGTGKVAAHSRFIGLGFNGVAAYDFKWWIFHTDDRRQGDYAFGFYTRHDGQKEIVFVYNNNGGGRNDRGFYFIDANGNLGSEHGTFNR